MFGIKKKDVGADLIAEPAKSKENMTMLKILGKYTF